MAKVKCKYCGKKIDEKYKRCPKCHKYLLRGEHKYLKPLLYGGWILIQAILCLGLYFLSKELLYSEEISDLLILGLLCLVIIVSYLLASTFIYKNRKRDVLTTIGFIAIIVSFCFSLYYAYNISKAIRYGNSNELLMLSENYDFSLAKEIKEEIERVFEYDENNTFSRDVIISNLYTDGKYSNLYLEDSYGNYKLKFYVDFDDFKIKDIFWEFGDNNLYLVKDGEKTEQFEYYYAMNIVNKMLGEEVSGLARLDSAIEKEVGKEFAISANTMFNYEELEYHYSSNSFTIVGNAYNMDYSGGMEEKEFTVTFNKNVSDNNKHIWYYGDSSFDYVKWDVKI